MNLSRLERETIILFNEQEPTARVETFNARLLKQLDRAEKVSEAVTCEQRETGYGVYTVPKALVKIHVPRPKKECTAAEQEALSQKMKALCEKRAALKNQI